MNTKLDLTAPNTDEFFKYVLRQLIKRKPLKKGKLIKIRIQEGLTPFPEFTQNVLDGDDSIKVMDKIEDADTDIIRNLYQISDYLNDKLKYHTATQIPLLEKGDPLILTIPFMIVSGKDLLKFARELGIGDAKTDSSENIKSGVARKNLKIVLYLTADGELWRELREDYHYNITETSPRYKLIRYLAENEGYQPTNALSDHLEGKKPASIRKDIPRFNRRIKNLLELDEDDVIEGEQGSGYRINPKYLIKVDFS